MKLAGETLESVVVSRHGPTAEYPQKGYDNQEVRDIVAEFGFTAYIRARGKKRSRSNAKRASVPADGWWNARTVG